MLDRHTIHRCPMILVDNDSQYLARICRRLISRLGK